MAFLDQYGPWGLVTGASAGLGEHFARQLAARGLNLIVVARRRERLRTLCKALEAEHGIRTHAVALDLTTPGAIGQLRQEVAERELGLLVNNAGFGLSGSFLDHDLARLQQMVRLNCEVPVTLTQALVPPMVQRRRGGIILVASTAAYQCTPWMAVYGATKVFDLHLGEALTVELGRHGLDVLTVSPGHTDTEFHQVAGVPQAALGGAADPADVVAQALDRLGHQISFVHGGLNKVLAFGNRFAPRALSAWGAGRVLGRRLIPGKKQGRRRSQDDA